MRRVPAILPHHVDEALLAKAWKEVCRFPLLVKHVNATRLLSRKFELQPRIHDIVRAAHEAGVSNNDDMMSNYVWKNKFCNHASAEWHTDPLTELQIFHVTYYLDLLDGFVEKVGVDAIPLAKMNRHSTTEEV